MILGAAARWRVIDREVRPSTVALTGNCDVSLEAAGTRLDVNAASDEMLVRLLRAVGHGDEAIEMVDALEDWRDTNDVSRPSGAEREWYTGAHRMIPRNADIADIRELARVRGFEDLARYDSVLTTEMGRVSLATAPVSVLMAVPGITRETAERIVALRDAGTPLRDAAELPYMVSAASRAELLEHFPEIVRLTTADPDAWIMVTRAQAGFPPSTVALEWRLVRSGARVVVVRTRVLP
jgi:DNA uptake protein ComE-like DNA-binding protein